MGSYLSEPVTEKHSSDHSNERLICGASSMQGWRVSQEDAHNCVLDYDANAAFFAVYDGHGGQEVAQYCSQKLPDFIKALSDYKEGKIEEALVKGFLGFDSLIATPEVIAILKELAGEREAEEQLSEDENVDYLYEEAAMPIEQVIEKYTSNLMNPAVKALKKADDKLPKSPFLKGKKENDDDAVGTSAASSSGSGSSSAKPSTKAAASDLCSDGVSSSSEAKDKSAKNLQESNGEPSGSASSASAAAEPKEDEKSLVPDSSDMKVDPPASSDSPAAGSAAEPSAGAAAGAAPAAAPALSQNGEATGNDVTSSSAAPAENGDVKGKGKGKAKAKPKAASPAVQRPKRNAQQLYKNWLEKDRANEDDDSEEEEDEEEDKTFEGPNGESSDEDMEASNSVRDDPDTTEDDEEEEIDDDDDDEDDDEDDEDEDDENLAFAKNMKEEPGSDSGCTAVIALLNGNELFVANAGDSRCIVCRDGKAVDMSFDHKPEDEPEKARIIKAGGKVTGDGRVNGGLNLSRAIGDHAYKQNKDLSDKEQMITALPDIQKLTVDLTRDEFMVLACDGIWNFMSSQEVVDFVRPRLTGTEKLSQICEEMFDHCLAPNTLGDGTGCDNMTAIIVKFKGSTCKRPASPQSHSDPKRAKTDDSNGAPETKMDTKV